LKSLSGRVTKDHQILNIAKENVLKELVSADKFWQKVLNQLILILNQSQ
jgi:hypothetical protein